MIFNLVYFFFDTKDYQDEERIENEKEERRKMKEEERKKKEAEKRKKRLDNMMSPAKRRLVNGFIYAAFIGIAAFVFRYIYNYSLHLSELQDIENGVYHEPVYNFDEN